MTPQIEVWFLFLWTRDVTSRFSRGYFPLQGSVAYPSYRGQQQSPVYEGQAYPAVQHGSDYSDNVNQFNPNEALPRPYSPPFSSNPYPYPEQQGYTRSQASEYQSQNQGSSATKEFGSDYQSDSANRMIVVSKSFGKGKMPGLHRIRVPRPGPGQGRYK